MRPKELCTFVGTEALVIESIPAAHPVVRGQSTWSNGPRVDLAGTLIDKVDRSGRS
jgi:hypothetical protein